MRAWWQQHHSILSAIKEFESKRKKHSPNTEQEMKSEGKKAEVKECEKVKRRYLSITIDDVMKCGLLVLPCS
jgi:hypothetical protein